MTLPDCRRSSRTSSHSPSSGVIDGEQPNAADLQIGATIRVLLPIADLRPLLAGNAAERIALRFFPEYPGEVPAGRLSGGLGPGILSVFLFFTPS